MYITSIYSKNTPDFTSKLSESNLLPTAAHTYTHDLPFHTHTHDSCLSLFLCSCVCSVNIRHQRLFS